MIIKISVVGVYGKMGSLSKDIIDNETELELIHKISSSDPLTLLHDNKTDILLDFSNSMSVMRNIRFYIKHNINAIIGASGVDLKYLKSIKEDIKSTLFIVPNFSIGAVLSHMFSLKISKYFKSIDIVETHSHHKLDAPSQTASHLFNELRNDKSIFISVHSLRKPGYIAEQSVIASSDKEIFSITHKMVDRDGFINGIKLALLNTEKNKGLIVGLDKILRLDT